MKSVCSCTYGALSLPSNFHAFAPVIVYLPTRVHVPFVPTSASETLLVAALDLPAHAHAACTPFGYS